MSEQPKPIAQITYTVMSNETYTLKTAIDKYDPALTNFLRKLHTGGLIKDQLEYLREEFESSHNLFILPVIQSIESLVDKDKPVAPSVQVNF